MEESSLRCREAMTVIGPRLALFSVLALICACAPRAPRLQLPFRTEANCESRAVKQTAINAIVASTDDTIRSTRYPGDRIERATIRRVGGVFAYWRSQPFEAPDTAHALGVKGDLTLLRAVITNEFDTANHWRPVWLTFASPRGARTVLERAYDIQDICIEGQREA